MWKLRVQAWVRDLIVVQSKAWLTETIGKPGPVTHFPGAFDAKDSGKLA
jgi:hypothetical protein